MRLFLCSAIAALALPTTAGNLLLNGDFEKGMEGWTVWGAKTDTLAHAGKGACLASSTENAWSGASQVVAIPVGTRSVVLSGWIQSEGVRPGPEDWNKGRLWLDFLDIRDSVAGGWQLVAGQAKGRIAWTAVQRVYQVPEGAVKIKVMCALANARGSFRCDDIELTAAP